MKTTKLMQYQPRLLGPTSCFCEQCCHHLEILTTCWTKACVFMWHRASQMLTQPVLIEKTTAQHSNVATNEETWIPCQNGWPCHTSRNLNGLRWERAWLKMFFPAFKENDPKNWLQMWMRVSAGEEEKGRWETGIWWWYWCVDPELPAEPN